MLMREQFVGSQHENDSLIGTNFANSSNVLDKSISHPNVKKSFMTDMDNTRTSELPKCTTFMQADMESKQPALILSE